jgi:Zn-dependent peptidase ImmA (M78 family)
MSKRIHLHYSDDVLASPYLRQFERLAHADRLSLHSRFGEPCDPRKLANLYDIHKILETYEDYEEHFQRSLREVFDDLQRWSGVLFQIPNGEYIILVNPAHHSRRRTLTIAHEFGHLALGHQPITIENDKGMSDTRFSDDQEQEAFWYGLAVLLPYAPLLQFLQQGASISGVAHHYGISTSAVEMRLKVTGLWDMQKAESIRTYMPV